MNYFELINKCLVELNYKTCDSFTDLVKNDHEKIKNILNIINGEVCGFDNWNFLLRKLEIYLPKNTSEILNTISGRIHSLYIDDIKYGFFSDFEKFMLNKQPSNTYTVFNDKILLPAFTSDKTIEIVYYTNNFSQDKDGQDISSMSSEDDVSVIPVPFVEPILVYGTCMRFKGNAEYSKFSFWYGMYKDALANLRAKIGSSAFETPTIRINRQ
ncbi:MAG: hypothetical protein PHC64_03280 [Candidatus Gastranaerophilales bacterium]|nr:hypothetical protein [Candidatus Gastranaerophilales bacterium]